MHFNIEKIKTCLYRCNCETNIFLSEVTTGTVTKTFEFGLGLKQNLTMFPTAKQP
jgi:hypothetical protein